MNKVTMVLQWLEGNAGISSKEAFEEFGETRLSDTILKLRRRGHNIETVMCEGRNRFGKPVRFARYYLRD